MDVLILCVIAGLCFVPLLAPSWKWLAWLSAATALYVAALWGYILYWIQQNPDAGLGAGIGIALVLVATIIALSVMSGRAAGLFVQRRYSLPRWKILPIDLAVVFAVSAFGLLALFGFG